MEHTRSDTRPSGERIRVLFVCLGNICRSPLAEGVFLHLAREAGVEDRFEVDSAGTGDWHVGERPDPRATAVASKYGVELPSIARQVTRADFDRFDHIVAMDRDNLRELERMAKRGSRAKVQLLRVDDPERGDEHDVPDPYYGGPSGFDAVYRMVHRSAEALLDRLLAETGAP
ncbi:MAG: low molecular weight protein-tyrosine-phosphatase [Gemmatimonadales bacterium]